MKLNEKIIECQKITTNAGGYKEAYKKAIYLLTAICEQSYVYIMDESNTKMVITNSTIDAIVESKEAIAYLQKMFLLKGITLHAGIPASVLKRVLYDGFKNAPDFDGYDEVAQHFEKWQIGHGVSVIADVEIAEGSAGTRGIDINLNIEIETIL